MWELVMDERGLVIEFPSDGHKMCQTPNKYLTDTTRVERVDNFLTFREGLLHRLFVGGALATDAQLMRAVKILEGGDLALSSSGGS